MNWILHHKLRILGALLFVTIGGLASYAMTVESNSLYHSVYEGWRYSGTTTLTNEEYASLASVLPDGKFTIEATGHSTITASYAFLSVEDAPVLERTEPGAADKVGVQLIRIIVLFPALFTFFISFNILMVGNPTGRTEQGRTEGQ